VCLWCLRRRKFEGQVALIGIALYAALRFVVENFRGDSIRGVWFDGRLSTSQLISLVAGSVAVTLLVTLRKRSSPASAS
jgi:prolipoprotein diacylglyceryltransferase